MKKVSAFMIILMVQIASASNGKEAIGCKVHGLNSKDGHFRFKESSTFDTGAIFNNNDSKTLEIIFKTLTKPKVKNIHEKARYPLFFMARRHLITT